MKERYVRPGGELTDETIVVVRGGELRRELLEADARRAFAAYGTYAHALDGADAGVAATLASALDGKT